MKILIDLKSIRKNPNAHSRTENLAVRWEGYISGNGKAPEILNDLAVISSWNDESYEGYLKMPLLPEQHIQLNKLGVTVKEEIAYQTIHTPPQPEYLYQYVPTGVKCPSCGEVSDHDQYEEDWIEVGEYGTEVPIIICPKCSHCVDLEFKYETVEEALKRKL